MTPFSSRSLKYIIIWSIDTKFLDSHKSNILRFVIFVEFIFGLYLYFIFDSSFSDLDFLSHECSLDFFEWEEYESLCLLFLDLEEYLRYLFFEYLFLSYESSLEREYEWERERDLLLNLFLYLSNLSLLS